MVKRINRTVRVIIALVLVLVIGNQITLWQYEKSSQHLLLEYHEMHALQEFKLSLKKFQTTYLESKEFNQSKQLDSLFSRVQRARHNCEVYVTKKHLGENWQQILLHFETIQSSDFGIYTQRSYERLKAATESIQIGLDNMILETEEEIIETENRNNTLLRHSTLTLLTAGLAIVIIISILSISTARGITGPIKEFLATFKKLGSGDRTVRVNYSSGHEFGKLADEFNSLFDKLDKTTVTLAYFRNIIDSIYGALFVTDKTGRIQSYNKTVTKLLGFDESELVDKQITTLFKLKYNPVAKKPENRSDELIRLINSSVKVYAKSGTAIPTLTTCTSFTSDSEDFLIVVVHDITEKLAFEKEIEETKRKSKIAINTAQESERMRFATELHDSLGQKLSAVSYAFQDTYDCIQDKSKINEIQELLDDAIDETRKISHRIMPGVLKDFGLCAALEELVSSTNNLHKTYFHFNKFDLNERIDQNIEKVLYRICQEATNYILKHAEAEHATIQLFKSPQLITMTIEDDGIGFDPESPAFRESKGIGLLSIEERISSYNGEFTLNSNRDQGTELIVEIPCSV